MPDWRSSGAMYGMGALGDILDMSCRLHERPPEFAWPHLDEGLICASGAYILVYCTPLFV